MSWWLSGLCLSTLVCVFGSTVVFNMPWYQPLFATLIALLVALMAVRALGETDLNPVSGVGKLSQAVFSLISSSPSANLVAGAISEAGAMQAGPRSSSASLFASFCRLFLMPRPSVSSHA
jgi:hypothetical protein